MEEKLKQVFEREYSENRLTDFLIKTQKTYEFFGYEFKLKPTEIASTKFYGGKIWLNEDYVNSVISNLEYVQFESPYPKLIAKIADTNLEYFNEVYSKLIDIYQLEKNIDLKKYINLAYGCLQNNQSMIYSKNIYLVPIRLNKMLHDILLEFKGHIIYIDTDQIFFRNFNEIKERFEKYFNNINKYDLTYYSKTSKFGLFIANKKYIFEENSNIRIKGMKCFNTDGIMSRGGYINIR